MNNNCAEQSGVDEGAAGVRVDDGLMLTLKILPGGKYVVGCPPEAKGEVDDITDGVDSACAAALEMED